MIEQSVFYCMYQLFIKKDVSLNAVHVKDICQNILLIILANSAIKKRQITGYYKAQTYFTQNLSININVNICVSASEMQRMHILSINSHCIYRILQLSIICKRFNIYIKYIVTISWSIIYIYIYSTKFSFELDGW